MNIFEDRLKRNEEELKQTFASLYGESEFETLVNHLDTKWRLRRVELKKLDEQRLENPNWYLAQDMVGLTLYTELFSKDIKGLIKKIPYLKKTKIKYLHLMPILSKPKVNNDGGYAVNSFTMIDKNIGNNRDIVELTKKLRENNISLCLDFPLNHTANTHPWAKKAIKGDKEYQEYYLLFDSKDEVDTYAKNLPEVFPKTSKGNFTYDEKMKKYIWTTFHSYQWDLNYRNPKVFLHMLDSMLYLANLGVEVIRLDAIPYIWKEINTNCRNLKEVHTLIRLFRLALEIVAPGVILKGEVVMGPKELSSYFGTKEKPECHLLYASNTMANLWSSLASSDVRVLKEFLNDMHSLDSHCNFVNYLRCHDDIGWGLDEEVESRFNINPQLHKEFLYNFYSGNFENSFAKGQLYNYDEVTKDARNCGTTASLCGLESDEKELAIKRILLLHSTGYFLKSFFMLNSGDEIGLTNDYEYVKDEVKAHDSRNLHRVSFDAKKAKTTEGKEIYSTLVNFSKARKAIKAFNSNASITTWDTDSNKVLAVKRNYKKTEALLFANFSNEDQWVKTEYLYGEYKDYFTNVEYTPGIGFIIKPYQYLWLVKEGEK